MSPLEDVRATMMAFADGRMTASAYRAWLAGRAWDPASRTPARTVHLLRRAEMLVAEHGRRHINLASLRAGIREAVEAAPRGAHAGLLVRESGDPAPRSPRRRRPRS